MSTSLFLICILTLVTTAKGQTDTLAKTRFLIGISAPEFLHLGIGIDVTRSNQLSATVGIAPTWGGVWPALSIEHRLYFGSINPQTNRRNFFFRQSGTFYPTGDNQSAFTLTVGGDLNSRKRHKGWTIDGGLILLVQNKNDRENKLYPALRFQHYSFFRKKR